MIVSDKFVFIHLHKTAGQFISSALLKYVGGCQQIGYHWPRKYLPAEFQGLPLLGFVRNPWDWYVSWFCFNQQKPGKYNPLYAVMSDGGRNKFASTITNMIHFGGSSKKSQRHLSILRKTLPNSLKGNRGIGLTRSCLNTANGSFYSWQFRRMFSDDSGQFDGMNFARMENLRVDFLNFLERIEVSVPQEMKTFIEIGEKQNSSRHDHYRNYYDDDLRILIEDNDRLIVEKFGYRF